MNNKNITYNGFTVTSNSIIIDGYASMTSPYTPIFKDEYKYKLYVDAMSQIEEVVNKGNIDENDIKNIIKQYKKDVLKLEIFK